jgi:hypothetical protein
MDGDVALLWSPVLTRDGLMFAGAGTASGRIYLRNATGSQIRQAPMQALAVAGEPDEVFAVQDTPQGDFLITRSAPDFR